MIVLGIMLVTIPLYGKVQAKLDQYQATMDRLNYKISRYEEAVKTGVLNWDDESIQKN